MVAKYTHLVVEENGEKTIVGFAVLDMYNANQMDISGTITEPSFARRLFNASPGEYSIVHKPKVSEDGG